MGKMIKKIVDEEATGKRLDVFLSQLPEIGSRALASKLIKNKKVLVNNKSEEKDYHLKQNEVIEVTLPEPETTELVPEMIDFKVLYDDDYLAVISKPAGIVTHPSHGHKSGTLVHGLLARFSNLSEVGGYERLGIVHRLDKNTSGILIVAKDNITHQKLSNLLKQRKIEKCYLALVNGKLGKTGISGIIKTPIGRHPVNRKKMAVIEGGKPAETVYEVIETFKNFTLLKVCIKTGRTHQIRVHLSHIHHPVAGDELYGGKNKITNEFGLVRQFLHANQISFNHPIIYKEVYLEDELPDDLSQALENLRKEVEK